MKKLEWLTKMIRVIVAILMVVCTVLVFIQVS